MAIQGICFDLDGTLIDSVSTGLIRICEVAKNLNLPMDEKIEMIIKTRCGQHPHDLIMAAWPNVDSIQFYKKWQELDIAEPFSVFPGIKEALTDLYSERFYLTVLTNRDFKTTARQLEHNNILQFFDLVIGADLSHYKKPDPRSIVPIFHRYRGVGVNPKKSILVGDTVENDWKLAQAVEVEFFAVTFGGMDTREKFINAGVSEDHIINSVADLPKILIR